MIVSHKHKFIFIKTRKTAGTSIEIALSAFLGPDDIVTRMFKEDEATRQALGYRGSQHTLVPLRRYALSDWKDFLRTRERVEFYNHMPASLVRRYVGEKVWDEYFTFCFERNPYDKAISKYHWRARRSELPPLADYLRSVKGKISDWRTYTIDGRIAVDFVGRFERLTEDLEEVRRRIGLPAPLVLPKAKGGYRKDKRHYSEVLNDEERALIEQTFAREIEAFGYRFEAMQRAE